MVAFGPLTALYGGSTVAVMDEGDRVWALLIFIKGNRIAIRDGCLFQMGKKGFL